MIIDTEKLGTHGASELFPLIPESQYRELVSDIRENGQLEPVWVVLKDGLYFVLDGRHRVRACHELLRAVDCRVYEGDDPYGFVVSLNLHRRHLSESQRAMVAGKLATMKQGRPEKGSIEPLKSNEEAANLLNVGKESVKRAKQVQRDGVPELGKAVESGKVSVSAAADVATLPQEEQSEVVARGESEILATAKKIRAEKTEKRRQERHARIQDISEKSRPLDTAELGQYPVIYCDPPWRYEDGLESASRSLDDNHYPTMALDDIRALDVASLATEDCVLFLWATPPKVAEALSVIEAWGFDYRTNAVWVKDKIGMGHYVRQQHEILLVGSRGNPLHPATKDRVSSVLRAPRTKHSEKPVEFAELIERMYPGLPKIELFCRSPREGWAVWGNEATADEG